MLFFLFYYYSHGVIDSDKGSNILALLSNMFNKTTLLIPEGFFASLGVSRGVEGDLRGVKLVCVFCPTNFFISLFLIMDLGHRSKYKTSWVGVISETQLDLMMWMELSLHHDQL